jgi:O-acetyl-ADP-ribose deacetylase (regulator of RNase III)
MVKVVQGNLLEAKVEALVNTVNTVGVMGKGIALQFKRAFPENFKAYEKASKKGELEIGKMFTFDLGAFSSPRFIINFPTKEHWRGNSKLEYIDAGLNDLVNEVRRLKIISIAIPALGCSNGGLAWQNVRPRIEAAFADLTSAEVLLFAPLEADATVQLLTKSKKPTLTPTRAAVLKLMAIYEMFADELSRLEAQKLIYFVQNSGYPVGLSLAFEKQQYGPYADGVRHVLLALEGHYLEGLGDFNKDHRSHIHILPRVLSEIDDALTAYPEAARAVERVATLIEGFETPLSMELLATVHWIAVMEKVQNEQEIYERVRAWNERKRTLFSEQHLKMAWQHLKEQGWLMSPHLPKAATTAT